MRIKMLVLKIYIRLFLLFFFVSSFYAQTLDLEGIDKQIVEKFQKPPFSLSGSLSGSGVYYHTEGFSSRLPFTYFLTGNLNIWLYDWNIPLSYSYTNQGANFNYTLPFRFNRLSLHPKYKSLQFHIGDVTMQFSPYTYNGLPFTGFGFEFLPEEFPFRGGFFIGRLQKSVEYNSEVRESRPYYERWGYGLDLQWVKPEYELRAIGFYAEDKEDSLQEEFPLSLNVRPERGFSYSFFGKVKPMSFLEVYGEYALSGLVEDVRLLSNRSFFSGYSSSQKRNALNAGMSFLFSFGTFGFRYERIDPDYRTLGAYYFVNDMENITLNGTLNMLSNRLTLTTSVGKQRDNLNRHKILDSNQWVGSVNVSFKPTKKTDMSLNYSNFTSFTNRRLNQFDDINQNPLYLQRPEDSLTYRQISQNALATFQYHLSENQQLTLNYSVNDVVNRENEVTRTDGKSRFHNGSIVYTLNFPEKRWMLAPMFNLTQSQISGQSSYLLGPSLNVNKLFFLDKLNASFGTSYNYGEQPLGKSRNAVFRLALGYVLLKRHQFQLSGVQTLHHSVLSTGEQTREELTISFGYNYHFEKTPLLTSLFSGGKSSTRKKNTAHTTASDTYDNQIVAQQRRRSKREKPTEEPPKEAENVKNVAEKATENIAKTDKKTTKAADSRLKLKYDRRFFEGTPAEVTHQLLTEKEVSKAAELRYMPWMEARLDSIFAVMQASEGDLPHYKKEASLYVSTLNEIKEKERELGTIVFGVLNKLYLEASKADDRVKQRVLDSKRHLDTEGDTVSKEANFENSFELYVIHHQMKKDFYGLSLSQVTHPEGVLKELLEASKGDMYKILDDKRKTKLQKTNSIQMLITDYYYKKYQQQTQ